MRFRGTAAVHHDNPERYTILSREGLHLLPQRTNGALQKAFPSRGPRKGQHDREDIDVLLIAVRRSVAANLLPASAAVRGGRGGGGDELLGAGADAVERRPDGAVMKTTAKSKGNQP